MALAPVTRARWLQRAARATWDAAEQALIDQRRLSSTEAGTSGRIFAACVLERLPVVKQPPPAWEAEYKAWAEHRRLQQQHYKLYPSVGQKQGGDAGRAADGDDGEEQWRPVPLETEADRTGDKSTMRRKLGERLLLLVKHVAPAPGTSSGWGFPTVQHREGETVRAAAERALREAIGPAAVFFIGNAPMGHLEVGPSPASASGGAAAAAAPAHGDMVFFLLAQVVNDPWEVQVSAGAELHAWVTKSELEQYLLDAHLLDLANRML